MLHTVQPLPLPQSPSDSVFMFVCVLYARICCVSLHQLMNSEARGYPNILLYQFLPYSFESGFLTELGQQGPRIPLPLLLALELHESFVAALGFLRAC